MKTRLALYVTSKVDGDFFHVEASIVTLGRVREYGSSDVTADTIRNANDVVNGLYVQSLRVGSQGNNRDAERKLYGFEVRYRDVYAVELNDAKKMFKTLQTIERKMAKLNDKFGYPETFGQYLARVANAIGAKEFVFLKGTARGWSYRDSEHTIAPVLDGVHRVDTIVHTWAHPEAQEAAS